MLNRSGQKRILVVEDNRIWRNRISRILKNAGYQVSGVSDDIAAIEILESADLFDLIVLDLQLDTSTIAPRLYEGWKILQRIKSFGTNTPIPTIIITGHPEEYIDNRDKIAIEANYFVSKKNFNKKRFLELVHKAIFKHNL